MRVIGGIYRSRPLRARVPGATRPTGDRLRETLFNILGSRVIESVFLDAYAGTGAVGIEAISRGAGFVHFVDRSKGAVGAIRANLDSLECRERHRVLGVGLDSAFRLFLREGIRFDLVFLDPPYREEERYARDLDLLGSEPVLSPGAWVVAEHPVGLPLPAGTDALGRFRTCRQGSTALSFYRSEDT